MVYAIVSAMTQTKDMYYVPIEIYNMYERVQVAIDANVSLIHTQGRDFLSIYIIYLIFVLQIPILSDIASLINAPSKRCRSIECTAM